MEDRESGAVRICYVYYAAYSVILLVVPYAKNEKVSLTATDKAYYKKLIQQIDKQFAIRFKRGS